MSHGKIITLLNSKGGVGKSTLSLNLAQYLHSRGLSVKIYDCDYRQATLHRNYLRVQQGKNRPADGGGTFDWPRFEGVEVQPEVVSPGSTYVPLYDKESMYRTTQVTILDCGPSVLTGFLPENVMQSMEEDATQPDPTKRTGKYIIPETSYDPMALACLKVADLTIVPVACAQMDLHATRILLQAFSNPYLQIRDTNQLKVVFNLTKASIKTLDDARKKLSQDIDFIKDTLGYGFFETIIHRYEAFVNSNNDGYSVMTRYKSHKRTPPALEEIKSFGGEVIAALGLPAAAEEAA